MESVALLTRTILVILSTCYTSGLELTDLYPYGTEHGDTLRIGFNLLEVPLLAPIDNLVAFGPAGHTGTDYLVGYIGFLAILDGRDRLYLNLLVTISGDSANTEIYYRTTDDPVLIKKSMDQINEGFPNTFCSTSPPTQLIIATWIDYLKTDSNPGSNFQLIVVTNGSNTFGIALYVSVSITSVDATGIDSDIDGNFAVVDYSLFPFGTTVANAPNMMLNSNTPGTYIFPLNDIPPVPCTEPDCSAVCKTKLLRMTCEAMRINGKDLPAPCHNN